MLTKIKIPGVSEKSTNRSEELDNIIANSLIDTSVPVRRPPVILEIREQVYGGWQRLFSLGNFSAIIGKAKSRKTFLTSLITAACATNTKIYDYMSGNLPENKRLVIRIDTEQSEYDAYKVTLRDEKLSGVEVPNYAGFALREFPPLERCEIVEHLLERFKDNLGLVIIDGIADLATAINDEIEASRVTNLLLKWTKKYDCHICTVIHQNKSNNFATGHLGSSIMKKSEVVLSVNKSDSNHHTSEVSCDMIRGAADFEPFTFTVDGDGMPVILGKEGINTSFKDIRKI